MKSADVTLTLIYPFCMLTQQREERLGNTLPACVGVSSFSAPFQKINIHIKIFLILWINNSIKYKNSRSNWNVHIVSYSKHQCCFIDILLYFMLMS